MKVEPAEEGYRKEPGEGGSRFVHKSGNASSRADILNPRSIFFSFVLSFSIFRSYIMESSHLNTSTLSRDDEQADITGPRKRARLNPPVEFGLMRDGSGFESPSFVGSASGIHFIRSVYGSLNAKTSSKPVTGETPESNIVPGEDDRLPSNSENASSKPLWQTHEVDSHALSPSMSCTFDDLLEWTSSYFDVWHPSFPFLHAPSILEKLEAIAHGGFDKVSLFDLATIRAIISISLADRRQTDTIQKPVPKCLVFNSFDDAISSVQAAMIKPASVQSLQATVCVQLFLVSMLRLNGASRLGGLIIRLVFQLGFHRCPTRYSSFKIDEQNLRRRLFWSIYCIDRHICQALGLPLTLRDDDVDVCYPDNELHISPRDLAAGRENVQPGPAQQHDDRLRLLTLIARHAEIRGQILELRNKKVEQREDSWDRVVAISARLTRWWNQVEDAMEQAEIQDMPLSILHQTVLKVFKHESIISLNRPLLASSKKNPNYAAALHSCISASKSIIKALTALSHPVPSFTSASPIETSSCPMFWPSFTWSIWMSAFIILYAALENEVEYQVAVR